MQKRRKFPKEETHWCTKTIGLFRTLWLALLAAGSYCHSPSYRAFMCPAGLMILPLQFTTIHLGVSPFILTAVSLTLPFLLLFLQPFMHWWFFLATISIFVHAINKNLTLKKTVSGVNFPLGCGTVLQPARKNSILDSVFTFGLTGITTTKLSKLPGGDHRRVACSGSTLPPWKCNGNNKSYPNPIRIGPPIMDTSFNNLRYLPGTQ